MLAGGLYSVINTSHGAPRGRGVGCPPQLAVSYDKRPGIAEATPDPVQGGTLFRAYFGPALSCTLLAYWSL
jgi:hypothetical protein